MGARVASVGDAARWADVALVAVNWAQFDDVLAQAGDLAGKIVVTCSLPLNPTNTEFVVANTSSGAEELARRLPKARVASALGTVPYECLFDVFRRRKRVRRPHLVVCGDDAKAKKAAVRLTRDVGFDPVDAGPLRVARVVEPFSMLIARLAYETGRKPGLTYRFDWR